MIFTAVKKWLIRKMLRFLGGNEPLHFTKLPDIDDGKRDYHGPASAGRRLDD